MEQLLAFYQRSLVALAGAVVAWVVFVPKLTLEPVVLSVFSRLLKVDVATFLTSRMFVLLVLVAGEYVIRKHLWRVVHPALDVKGMWDGETTYTKAEVGNPSPLPPPAPHKIKFEQDCLRLRILPTESADYLLWGSLAVDLVEDTTIRYTYWVKYGDSPLFPKEAKGYEELNLLEDNWRGRPIALKGTFFHCTGTAPAYSGFVNFRRRRKWTFAQVRERLSSWVLRRPSGTQSPGG